MSLRIGIDARFLGHPRLGGYQTYIQELVAAFRRNPPNHDLWLIVTGSLPLAGRVREGVELAPAAGSLPLAGRDREGAELPLLADSLPLEGPRSADSLPLAGRDREGVPSSIHAIVQPIHVPFAGVAWREQVAIPRLARKLRFDVMHFPCNTMPSRLAAPAVATVHDTIGLDNRQPTHGLRQALIRRYEHFGIRNTLRRASMVITPSSAVASDLSRAGVPSSRVRTVHSGIRGSMRPAPRAAIEQFNREHDLTRPYLLTLASADPRKNVETAITALAALDGPPIDLVIVMSNALLKPRLQRLAADLRVSDRVRFLDALSEDQLARCYAGAAATLFLSVDEGFGMPPLESMACGTPVVCSDRPPMNVLYGDAVMLVDPANPASVTPAVRLLLDDAAVRDALVDRGYRRAAEFSWDRAAAQTLAIYEEVAAAC